MEIESIKLLNEGDIIYGLHNNDIIKVHKIINTTRTTAVSDKGKIFVRDYTFGIETRPKRNTWTLIEYRIKTPELFEQLQKQNTRNQLAKVLDHISWEEIDIEKIKKILVILTEGK
jgi:hypothetical protein